MAAHDPTTLLQALLELRADVMREGEALLQSWDVTPGPDAPEGLANMAHYVVLRRRDLRDLQSDLRPLGLSSLGRLEGHVVPTLDAVTRTLANIVGPGSRDAIPPYPCRARFTVGDQTLAQRSDRLFGPASNGSDVRVMVTLDSGSSDAANIRDLAERGATVFRVNCAHDGPDDWGRLADHVRTAEGLLGRPLKLLVDLGGPKVRTREVLTPGPRARLHLGDRVAVIEGDLRPGTGEWPFQFSTTIPGLASQLRPGDHLLVDDGRLDTVIERLDVGAAVARVVHVRDKGERLRADQGLNLPGVDLPVEALSPKDLQDLDFAIASADLVGLSFVRRAADIASLIRTIESHPTRRSPGIIAKIETPEAFRELPAIIAAGLGWPFGVMIARGDLAVELGFERLVEVQEEVLWLCESAHVPVIWATQVLEGLSKDGLASRAEVTDAAVASRAECVMLNKGSHVPEAVTVLSDILRRMSGHQRKKSAQLRALRAWG
ncbi:MAG: pyruvate kinase [Dehalococcoidia bacterium]